MMTEAGGESTDEEEDEEETVPPMVKDSACLSRAGAIGASVVCAWAWACCCEGVARQGNNEDDAPRGEKKN